MLFAAPTLVNHGALFARVIVTPLPQAQGPELEHLGMFANDEPCANHQGRKGEDREPFETGEENRDRYEHDGQYMLIGHAAPTIGLLLCETNNSALAEYALRDVAKPIGVSTYRVTRELPGAVRDELSTAEDLQEVVAKLRSEMEQLRQERDE